MKQNPLAIRHNRPDKRRTEQQFAIALMLAWLAPFALAAEYAATLQWSQRVELGTPVTGVVRDVHVAAGQKVGKGDTLLQLEDKVFKARVESAQTNLKSMQEHFEEATRERDRAQELYARTVLSDHDLQVAKNKYISALAERDKARYQLTRARYELEYSSLRAPFDAIVLQTFAQPGMVISSELTPQTLLILAQSNQMLARIEVDENVIAQLKPGQAANVTVSNTAYPGTIKAIGLEPLSNGSAKALFPVDIQFQSGAQLLRAGQSAKVEIP